MPKKQLYPVVHRQSQIVAKVGKLQADIEKETAAGIVPEAAAIKVRLNNLERFREQFENLQNEILNSVPVESYEEYDIQYANFEALVDAIAEQLETWKEELATVRAEKPVIIHNQPLNMPIPTFDGQYENWPKFKQMFTDIIKRCNDSDAVKLHNLEKALVGKAAGILNASIFCNNNFAAAWKMLEERFENPRCIIDTHIQGLLSLKKVETETAKGLRKLVETCQMHVEGLKFMGKPIEDTSNLIITHIVSSCLDPDTRKLWERSLPHGTFPELQETLKFIIVQCEVLERCDALKPQRSKLTKTICHAAVQEHQQPKACDICDGQHPIFKCEAFLAMPAEDRFSHIKIKKLCIKCLSPGHGVNQCKSKWNCRTCKQPHHTLLHKQDAPARHSEPTNAPHQPQMSLQCSNTASSTVLLSTIVVNILDSCGTAHTARALVDNGSQMNFLASHLVQELRLPKATVNIPLIGVGGTAASTARTKVNATIISRTSTYTTSLEFLVLTKPAADLPLVNIDPTKWSIPNGIKLADPTFYRRGKIDMILGAEKFFEFLKAGKITLGPNQPILMDTVFGWMVSGKVHQSTSYSMPAVTMPVKNIDQLMKQFFDIESIGTADENKWSVEERECEAHFTRNTKRDEEGRYIVRLPRKPEMINSLGESKSIALRRFHAIERKLEREPEVRQAYNEFMEEYEKLGHMTQVSDDDPNESFAYYLPHHAVFKAESSTTKYRVVFDASAKTSSGISLNDTLMVGPTIQEDSTSILTRFRTNLVALTADITKMYRQVWIHPQDRHLQRILWRPSKTMPLKVYELNTVTYGTASAPHLAIRTLKQTVEDHGNEFPKAAARFADFYVDDYISGEQTIEAAKQLQQETDQLFAKGGFSLRKWASNIPSVLSSVAHENLAVSPFADGETEKALMTLGLVWDSSTDEFRFKISIPNQAELLTKRRVLSYIAKIYDPLGIIEPVKATAKQLMQRIWALNINDAKQWGWDDELPESLQHVWKTFQSQLIHLRSLRIPRCAVGAYTTEVQLHIFCDASEKGYGACCYLRTLDGDGNTNVGLLVSKSKVTPLKHKHSIARLELCAAYLASQLFKNVSKAISITTNVTFWTDSMTVYHWLQSAPHRWKTFVANRVSSIQQATEGHKWNHVPGIDNPADLVSRGCLGSDLIIDSRWWQGPTWLSQPMSDWPQTTHATNTEFVTTEEKQVVHHVAEVQFHYIFSLYSSFSKLRRIIAYWVQFLNRKTGKMEYTKPGLTPNDLREAEIILCRLAQRDCFQAELKALRTKSFVSASSPLKWLHPQIIADGIIRVGGRLENSTLPIESKHPMVVPGNHPLATLIMWHHHLALLHAGPQLMLNTIRQKYWITGGRSLARKIYRQCHTCFRCRPPLTQTFMADLPASRVTAARPFSIVGIDYCGPVFVKGAHRRAVATKAFIAIFVCFVTRAVHIELVSDLSTEAFLSSLRRFVSRRGLPAEIHSDNGTNFKGAANSLNEVYKLFNSTEHQQHVNSWVLEKGITWLFIPPRAPHFGGLWEAAVRSAKHHLVRVLGTSSLTFEDMTTLLHEIECCLNSRPITPLTDDPSDVEALTPGHFLMGTHPLQIPAIDSTQVPVNRLTHWRHVQQLTKRFWDRWHQEYLQQLQPRAKWINGGKNQFHPGALVIVRDENVPSTRWPLARIEDIHPGKDGVTRVVTLKTGQGKRIVRPIVKICPLPMFEKEK